MTSKAPDYARPGRTEAGPLMTLAFLAVLFGAGAAGWAVLVGVVWLVWAYTLVAGSIVVALAVVALCAWLAVKGNRRAQILAAVIGGGVIVFVLWVATL